MTASTNWTDTVIAIILVLYIIPSIIAAARYHRQLGAIVVINLFLGWTLLGWVIALAWAFSATPHRTDVTGS